ncbi:PepSY-associated TM helix domain-containing protein [Leeuwenhoekiella sp. W20_SRS_FM14]|uniref:PepSY-associated TM helix domain-containing protein n=1 Tax=Leeuwenhoekiella sp. W20_SRS_FM14 TaxID=3240270 RepID=UPI003F96657B
MGNRLYNLFFSLHTVSGIVISVALYIIFFAGSFSFFRDDIIAWERNQNALTNDNLPAQIDPILDSLNSRYNLNSRDITLKTYYAERRVSVNLTAQKDTLLKKPDAGAHFFYLDPLEFTEQTYTESYTLGEFLYRLHFLTQFFYPVGYYVSGFVAFFFLIAILTGLLIHWKKIISNFYTFRPWAKLKTLWTDAHTALGFIGLPFQFVLAVTGAFFMLKILLLSPAAITLYGGDEQKIYEELEYNTPSFEFANQKLARKPELDLVLKNTRTDWPDFNINELIINNYGDANMYVTVKGQQDYSAKFNAPGQLQYCVATGETTIIKNPYANASYLDSVKNVMYRLHFGDYGGYLLHIISFLLGIITCVVIISGVMIWLLARDKKNAPIKKRTFYRRVALVYLAICLSMYPVTAVSFVVVKFAYPYNETSLYWFYLGIWALASLYLILRKNRTYCIKFSLLWGSIFGFLIPIANYIMTGTGIWKNFAAANYQIAFVDLFWIILATCTLFAFFKIKQSNS